MKRGVMVIPQDLLEALRPAPTTMPSGYTHLRCVVCGALSGDAMPPKFKHFAGCPIPELMEHLDEQRGLQE